MIKVNLLPARKVKRAADPGQGQIAAALGVLMAAAAAVYLLVHRPIGAARAELQAQVDELAAANDGKAAKLKDLEALKKLVTEQKKRGESIAQLQGARAIPANLLHELGEILTLGRSPTMTKEMAKKVSSGPGGDPNRRFRLDWDPKTVWITSFKEVKGAFTLEGGAQTDADITQLSKRLQASVYFPEVTPKGADRAADPRTGLSYYKFTITGKVVF